MLVVTMAPVEVAADATKAENVEVEWVTSDYGGLRAQEYARRHVPSNAEPGRNISHLLSEQDLAQLNRTGTDYWGRRPPRWWPPRIAPGIVADWPC